VRGRAIVLLGAGVAVLTPAASSAGKPDTSGASRATGTIAFVRAGRLTFMNGDGTARRITKVRVNGYPRWSRDGTRLAFFSDGPKARLYVARADGSRRAVTPPDPWACVWLDWSPSGRRIVYTRNNDCGGELTIFAVNRDGTARKQLTPGYGSFDAAWSPDGRRIVFGRFNDKGEERFSQLFVMRADGRDVHVIPGTVLFSANGVPTRPTAVWSRDGKRIYFIGAVDGHDDWTLAVIGVDDGDLRDVTPSLHRVFRFSFSPDWQRIAVAADDGRRRDIYVLNADGSDVRKLTDVRGVINDDPQWSPDGTRIAFIRRVGFEGNEQIYMMNADGSDQRNLSNSKLEEYGPVWRPRN
jgi:TolB protein